MDKYLPLRRYLEKQQANQVTLAFTDVERIISDSLPRSARTYPAWWANDQKHVHAAEWISAGWKTEGLSLSGERVTFVKKG